jgi:SAM-dependent methyltransferase
VSGASAALWHDVECGSYEADLKLWDELPGPVLELGCGTGRVSLRLARGGHRVVALDRDRHLLAVLAERGASLDLKTETADARDFELGGEFGFIAAPMQLIQLLSDSEQRRRCLARVASHLVPDGAAAFAIVESMASPSGGLPPVPDARESQGWVFSSLPVDLEVGAERIRLRRLRQTVSPGGRLSEETNEVELARLDAATLEAEAAGVGLAAAGRRAIPATEEHVGSTVVVLRRAV